MDLKWAVEMKKRDFLPDFIDSLSEPRERKAPVFFIQGIWQWDIKDSLHILKVFIYLWDGKNYSPAGSIGAEAAYLHNDPTSHELIPPLIDELLH